MATVRRVRRIIRKIDAWTVFKVSAVFWAVFAIAAVLGLVMFWSVVSASGIPQKITDSLIRITLLEEGAEPFADGERFLRLAVFGSLTWAVMATALTTLAAVMYNLISDVVGGVELVMLEETLIVPGQPTSPTQVAPSGTSQADLPTQETEVANFHR